MFSNKKSSKENNAILGLMNLGSFASMEVPRTGEKPRKPSYPSTVTRRPLNIAPGQFVERGVFDDIITHDLAKKIVSQYYLDTKLVDHIANYIQSLPLPLGVMNIQGSPRWNKRALDLKEYSESMKGKLHTEKDKELYYSELAQIMMSGGYIKI